MAFLTACLAGNSSFAHAEKSGPTDTDRERKAIQRAVERGELVPLPKILRLAQARVPGDVLEVEIEQEKGRITYEVKLLNSKGRVREVKLDGRTGRVVEIEDD